MRIVKNLVARWSKQLRRYVIVEAESFEHSGPVAYAGSGGGGGTETVPTGPFGPQIPFVMALFNEAAKIFQQGPPQFPDFPTVAQPGQDITGSQQNIRDIVAGNAGAAQTASDTALGAALGAGQNPVSNVANPLSGDLTQGLLQLLGAGQNPLAQQAGQTLPGATGAINRATGGVQGAQPNVQPGAAPGVGFGGPGLNFAPQGLPQLGPAGIDINAILQQNLGGSGLNPFIDETVQAATRGLVNNFQRNVIPSISDAAGQAGQAGGTRQGIAEGIAAGDLQQNVADVTAQLFAQGFDRNIGVQQNALGQVGQAQQGQANLGQNAAQLGLQSSLGGGSLGLQAEGLGLQGGQLNLGIAQLTEQIRNAIQGQALQGAGLAQAGAGSGLGLEQSGVSTGTSQIGNLLQAGNAQGLSQLFSSLGLLPGLQGNQLAQQGALNQSGLQQLGLEQTNIDAAIQEFFFNEFGPINALTQFQNFVSGPFGGSVGGNQQNLSFPGVATDIFQGNPNQPNPNTGDLFQDPKGSPGPQQPSTPPPTKGAGGGIPVPTTPPPAAPPLVPPGTPPGGPPVPPELLLAQPGLI